MPLGLTSIPYVPGLIFWSSSDELPCCPTCCVPYRNSEKPLFLETSCTYAGNQFSCSENRSEPVREEIRRMWMGTVTSGVSTMWIPERSEFTLTATLVLRECP